MTRRSTSALTLLIALAAMPAAAQGAPSADCATTSASCEAATAIDEECVQAAASCSKTQNVVADALACTQAQNVVADVLTCTKAQNVAADVLTCTKTQNVAADVLTCTKAQGVAASALACAPAHNVASAGAACCAVAVCDEKVKPAGVAIRRAPDGEVRLLRVPDGAVARGAPLALRSDGLQWPGVAAAQARAPAADPASDRPMLGVLIEESPNGVTITEVMDDSAAKAAGLQAGDVLFRVGEQRIDGFESLREALGAFGFGATCDVTVIREGEGFVTRSVELPQRAPAPAPEPPQAPGTPRVPGGHGFLGVMLEDTDDGVSVTDVVPSSGAWFAGIAGGDRILALDGHEIETSDHLVETMAGRAVGSFVEVRVARGDRELTLTARLGARQPALAPTPMPGVEGLRRFQIPRDNGGFFPHPDGKGSSFFFGDDEDHVFVVPQGGFGEGFTLDFDGDFEALMEKHGALFDSLDIEALVEKARKGEFRGDMIWEMKTSEDGAPPNVIKIEIKDGDVSITRDGETEDVVEIEEDATSVESFKQRKPDQDA